MNDDSNPPDDATTDKTVTFSPLASGSAEGADATPEPGATIGRYRVESLLGTGGMGVVLKVHDPDLDRTLALKQMRYATDPAEDLKRARFLEEAHVTAKLDHPAIVPVHELSASGDDEAWYAMKMVRGRELGEVIRAAYDTDSDWNLSRLVGVLVRVCQAMAYAHGKGVIHRDLKPANVMVGDLGEVYVMDWGLTRQLDRDDLHDIRLHLGDRVGDSALETIASSRFDQGDTPQLTMDGMIVGTPAYMPPEQAAGHTEEVDHQSDIYALGALLYEILTETPPFTENQRTSSPLLVLQSLLDGPPTPVQDLEPEAPEELVAICEKAMARERNERYASALELADDLQAWLDGRVVQAHATGLLVEMRKWIGRNRVLAAVAATAALALGVLAIGGPLVAVRQVELRSDADRARVAAQTSESQAKTAEARAVAEQEATRLALGKAQIALAEAAYLSHDNQGALRFLEQCPEDVRDTNWSYLEKHADEVLHHVEAGMFRGIAADPLHPGRFYRLDQSNKLLSYVDGVTGEVLEGLQIEDGFARMALSPDGHTIATVCRRRARVNVISTHPLKFRRFFLPKAFSHQNAGTFQTFFGVDSTRLFAYREQLKASVAIDLTTGETRVLLPGFRAHASHPRERWVYGVRGKELLAVDPDTGEIQWQSPYTLAGVTYMAVSAEGDYLMVGGSEGKVALYALANKELIHSFVAHQGRVAKILCGADPSLFLTLGAEAQNMAVKVWSAEGRGGEPLRRIPVKLTGAPNIALDARSRLLMVGLHGALTFVLPEMNHRPIVRQNTLGTAMFFDEQTVVSQTFHKDQVLGCFDLAGGEASAPRWAVPQYYNLIRSRTRDGMLATRLLNSEQNPIKRGKFVGADGLFDGKPPLPTNGLMDTCGIAPDQRYFVGGNNWQIKCFGKNSAGVFERILLPLNIRNQGGKVFGKTTHHFFPEAERPHYLISYLVQGADVDHRVYELFSLDTRKKVWRKRQPHAARTELLNPAGTLLVTGSPDGLVRGYDPLTLASRFEHRVHDRNVAALAFRPDGEVLATGDTTGCVRLWRMEAGAPVDMITELMGNVGAVEAIDFSPSGKRLITLAGGTVRLWEIDAGEIVEATPAAGPVAQEALPAKTTPAKPNRLPLGADFPAKGFFLTTRFAESHGRALESNDGKATSHRGGGAYLDKQTRVTGQFWKVLTFADGYFQLTNHYLEQRDMVLDGNDGQETSPHKGAVFMTKNTGAPSQWWKAIPLADGYFLLTTKSSEADDMVLNGNFQTEVPSHNQAAYMIKRTDAPRQQWKFEPIR